MSEHTADGAAVFEEALDAASAAFSAVIDAHFGRTFDSSPEDAERLLAEYRASSEHLRQGCAVYLRTGLVDADFICWHSALADGNFDPDRTADS